MLAFATILEYDENEVSLMTKPSTIKTASIFPVELKGVRWNDPESLAALEESNQIMANQSGYKHFKNVADLIADCLEGDDDE